MSVPDGAGRGSIYIQNETLRRGFTSTPNRVLCNAALSMGARFVFTLLLSYAWQDDRCFPGQERLARDVGCSVRTVQRYLTELEEAGEIRVIQQGLQRPNIYVILDRRADTTLLSRQEATIPSPLDAPVVSPAVTTPTSAPETSRVSPKKRSSLDRTKHNEENTQVVPASRETSMPAASGKPPRDRQRLLARLSRSSSTSPVPHTHGDPAPPIDILPDSAPVANDLREQAIQALLAEGISVRRATALARHFDLDEIVRQIQWLEYRRYDDRAACLVAAIEGRYGPPISSNGSSSRPHPSHPDALLPRSSGAGSTARYTGGNYGVCPACLSSPCEPDCPLSGN